MKVTDWFRKALFCLVIFLYGGVQAAELETCSSMTLKSGPKLEYCLKDLGQNSAPQDIIYFWHGVGGSAKNVFPLIGSQSDLYYVMIAQGKAKAPLFVGLSFGSQAVVPVEVNSSASPSLNELIQEVFPRIEKQFGYDLSKSKLTRHMMGLSLGGFNALNTVALKPSEFSSLIALCPALLTFNPFSRSEFKEYLDRHQGVIKRTKAEYMILMLREKFKTYPVWMSRNPLELLKAGKYQNTPVYLSTGLQDEYGFMEGAEAFASLAPGKVASSSVFAPIDGDHCFFDAAALEVFLKKQLQSWAE